MLIECQQCRSAISDSAARCPKCNALPDAFLGNRTVCDECGALYRPAFSTCGSCGAPTAIASRAERRLDTSASKIDLTAPVEGASQTALDLKKLHIGTEAPSSDSIVTEEGKTGSSEPAPKPRLGQGGFGKLMSYAVLLVGFASALLSYREWSLLGAAAPAVPLQIAGVCLYLLAAVRGLWVRSRRTILDWVAGCYLVIVTLLGLWTASQVVQNFVSTGQTTMPVGAFLLFTILMTVSSATVALRLLRRPDAEYQRAKAATDIAHVFAFGLIIVILFAAGIAASIFVQ